MNDVVFQGTYPADGTYGRTQEEIKNRIKEELASRINFDSDPNYDYQINLGEGVNNLEDEFEDGYTVTRIPAKYSERVVDSFPVSQTMGNVEQYVRDHYNIDLNDDTYKIEYDDGANDYGDNVETMVNLVENVRIRPNNETLETAPLLNENDLNGNNETVVEDKKEQVSDTNEIPLEMDSMVETDTLEPQEELYETMYNPAADDEVVLDTQNVDENPFINEISESKENNTVNLDEILDKYIDIEFTENPLVGFNNLVDQTLDSINDYSSKMSKIEEQLTIAKDIYGDFGDLKISLEDFYNSSLGSTLRMRFSDKSFNQLNDSEKRSISEALENAKISDAQKLRQIIIEKLNNQKQELIDSARKNISFAVTENDYLSGKINLRAASIQFDINRLNNLIDLCEKERMSAKTSFEKAQELLVQVSKYKSQIKDLENKKDFLNKYVRMVSKFQGELFALDGKIQTGINNLSENIAKLDEIRNVSSKVADKVSGYDTKEMITNGETLDNKVGNDKSEEKEVVQEQTKDEMAGEQTKDEIAEEQTEEQTKDNTTEEQTEDEIIEEQAKDNTTEEQTEDEIIEEQTKDNTTEEQTKDDITEEQTKDEFHQLPSTTSNGLSDEVKNLIANAIKCKSSRNSNYHKLEVNSILPGVAAIGLGLCTAAPSLVALGGIAVGFGGATMVVEKISGFNDNIRYNSIIHKYNRIARKLTKALREGDKHNGLAVELEPNVETGELRFIVTKDHEKVAQIDNNFNGEIITKTSLGADRTYKFDNLVNKTNELLDKEFKYMNDPKKRKESRFYDAYNIPKVDVDNLEAAFVEHGGYKFGNEKEFLAELDLKGKAKSIKEKVLAGLNRNKGENLEGNIHTEQLINDIASRNADALGEGTTEVQEMVSALEEASETKTESATQSVGASADTLEDSHENYDISEEVESILTEDDVKEDTEEITQEDIENDMNYKISYVLVNNVGIAPEKTSNYIDAINTLSEEDYNNVLTALQNGVNREELDALINSSEKAMSL